MLCWQFSSLINKKKSSRNVAREPSVQYTIANNQIKSPFLFPAQLEIPPKPKRISNVIIPDSQEVTRKLHSEKLGSSIGQWYFDS